MRHYILCLRYECIHAHDVLFPKYMCSYLGHKDVVITIEFKSPWDNDLIEPRIYVLGGSTAPNIVQEINSFESLNYY